MQLLKQLLARGRTVCGSPGANKKRLFETAASLIHDDLEDLPVTTILNSLTAREKLGSTGLGKGIAVPHCRIDGATTAVGTLLTLAEPIDFDAPDEQPVDIVFVLLVPAEATQEHLDILAGIAGLFQQDAFCQGLRAAGSSSELYEMATTWEGP